jgi:hypothetical protein
MSINFNKDFYSLEAIKKAIQDYKGLADFDIEVGKKNIKINLKNIDPESKDIIKEEFCNYVLGLMKNNA